MTRDSKILPILQVSAIVLALIVANITNPLDWGVSPIALKWLGLLSTIIGTVAGFLGTSPLKGSSDNNSVTPPRLPVVLLALTLGALLFGVSCAGNLRVQLVKAHQSIETALATADDTERIVCFGTKELARVPDPTHCTTALAVQAGLTDAKHREFHRLLSLAFAAQVRLGPVLQSWQGPGLPADLTEVVALSDQITALARTFNASVPDIGGLIQTVLRWQADLVSLKHSLAGGAL